MTANATNVRALVGETSDATTPAAATPRESVGQFTMSLQLSQQRQMNITGVVYNDDTLGDVNARVDMFQAVLERQFIKADIVNKNAQIQSLMLNLEDLERLYNDLAATLKRGQKLASTQQMAYDNYGKSKLSAVDQIESLRAAIAAAEKKLAE